MIRRARRTQAIVCGVIVLGAAHAIAAAGQVARPAAAQGAESLVATDPIRCWRRTGKSAVYIGERFSLTLTCSVVDTVAVRVVAEQSRLDPAALQLPPFDVVEGKRHADIQSGPRRLFQYEYPLRVIAEDLFGREVPIPALDVIYRVHSQVDTVAAVESMEQSYRLPALPVRVVALVPPQTVDIRDASSETFDGVQRRRFRGNVAYALAALLFSTSLGLLAIAAVAVVRRYRTPADRAIRLLSDADVLRSAVGELERVQESVQREGWNRDAIGQALAAVRVGMAMAMGRRLPQTILEPGTPGREGAVIARSGMIWPRRVMVSATVTADTLEAAAAGSGSATAEAPGRPAWPWLDDFRSILAVLTSARYGRDEQLPHGDLDEAVRDAVVLLRRLRAERAWTKSASRAVRGTITRAWPRVQ